MNSLMLLVAKILGVKSEGADSDVFALMEGAMNVMGIHNLLPQSARRVDIAEVATELLSGDQILIRTAGSKQRFHHGIFVGPISGVQGGKNLVVDCWGSQDAGKQEAKIRLRTLGEFMAVPGWPELAVMCWDSDTPELREFSAALALGLHRDLQDCSGLYHLLGRNCDHFATWCRTLRESRLDQDPDIAHFTSPSGDRRMRDARLQIDTYINFLARHTTYGIVQYTSPTDFADKLVHRKRAANIAKFMVETPSMALRKYDLIHWNCECFAWICKTGGLKHNSDQDDSFKEESNASEEPMTTTVEDYDALLRELENCQIKNQSLIKHNDELKLISETTMH
eukprot:gene29824-biopygen11539